MIINNSSGAIEILAPAKINLFLEVLGRRADGYHAIETVLCPINLFDRLILEPRRSSKIDFELVLPDDASPDDPAWLIPADERNLVIRALNLLRARLGIESGCRLRLEKSIPAAAGLAGGSSDAAAAVCAGLLAWSRWDRPLANALCAELGSDVPFFLGDQQRSGIAIATGRGEICELISGTPSLEFVVTHPPAGCATREVYQRHVKMERIRDSTEIIAACEDGQSQKIGAELFNALQFSAAGLTPWIEQQLKIFLDAGLAHCQMTGSGSSCFALLEKGAIKPDAIEHMQLAARAAGLRRIYYVQAQYCASIEDQL